MNTPSKNSFREEIGAKEVSIRLAGELCRETVDHLKSRLDYHYENGKQKAVIDFADVFFISSAGIGVIFSRLRKYRQTGGDIVLKNVCSEIENVFSDIGLLEIFTIE